MSTNQPIDQDQKALWNGIGGRAWVDLQETLDAMLRPFETLLVDAIADTAAAHVLDVGCGTGSTTISLARRIGARGTCVGVDISEPMLELARTRAEAQHSRATFLCADAQTHAFAPATFEAIASRFGVMFFADPVEAFANLRRAMRPGGVLRFTAWRSVAENPFMTTAERAAAPLLPSPPPRAPDGPGQFAFADDARVRQILEQSGWTRVDIRAIDVECVAPEPELMHYATRLGPLGRVLHELDEPTRAKVLETVRAAFEPYVHDDEVRFTAACWMVGARAQ